MNDAAAAPSAIPSSGSNTQTVTITDTKLAIFRETFGFVKNQHPAYLTLWAVLISFGAMIWFGGRYVVKTAVPEHLASIKEGYKELWDKHLQDKQATEDAHRTHMSQAISEMRQSIGEMKRGNELLESLIREFAFERKRQAGLGASNPGGGE